MEIKEIFFQNTGKCLLLQGTAVKKRMVGNSKLTQNKLLADCYYFIYSLNTRLWDTKRGRTHPEEGRTGKLHTDIPLVTRTLAPRTFLL